MSNVLPSALLAAILVAGCTTASIGPSASVADASTTLPSSADASPTPSVTPMETPTPTPTPPGGPTSGALPVHGSAVESGLRIEMAAGPDEGLFVSVPMTGGAVLLALLDSAGLPRPGWPIVLQGATTCGELFWVSDGSLRVMCTPDDLNQELNTGMRAYALDSKGRLLDGWPVDIFGFYISGQVVGDSLTLFSTASLGDVIEEGQPSQDGGLVTIAANGTTGFGSRITQFDTCCTWEVRPDGIAYGGVSSDETAERSSMLAIDNSGIRTGWPVSFDGVASRPAFGPGGRTVVTVGSFVRGTSRVLSFVDKGLAVSASSQELAIETIASLGETGGCDPVVPRPPLISGNGPTFVYSEIDARIYAADSSLAILPGWPYRLDTPLVVRDDRYVKEDAYCPYLALPAVGPDGTLYLPVQARGPSVGGSLIAVGTDGHIRSGWPVEIQRRGSEFWSVVVGPSGTAYALAIEPETSSTSSATILAIAPDSTVLWSSTIIEP